MSIKIIIFSSSESIQLATSIQSLLYYKKYLVELWTNNFFSISKSYISNFEAMKFKYDFAIVICSSDDAVIGRKNKYFIPRDNILLELGMCISAFSLEKVIIIQDDKVKMPSDLEGIESIKYNLTNISEINSVASMICAKIEENIQKKLLNSNFFKLSWDEYFDYVKKFITQLKQSYALGGFYFDILIGINRGGLMVADIISREFGQNVPVICLFADRRSGISSFNSTDLIIDNKYAIDILNDNRVILSRKSYTKYMVK